MDVDTATKLYEERLGRIKKALRLEQPDRVPIHGMIESSWAVHYAGYSIKEAVWDINTVVKAHEKLAVDFDFDIIEGIFVRSPLFYSSLGAKNWLQNKENGIVQHAQVMGMKEDEYPELIANPFRFFANKVLPRLYTELAKPGIERDLALMKATTIMGDIIGAVERGTEKLKKEYGLPYAFGNMTAVPLDLIANSLRTMEGMVLDIWRQPEQLEAACEKLLPLMVRLGKSGYPGPAREVPFVDISLQIASYLRPSYFERFYWPTFKKLVDTLAADGYSMCIFFEGDWTRFYDYLQELPSNKILGIMDQVDMTVAKNKLGKRMCLAGGYPLSLLQVGTKEECIKKAKEILDVAAPGGGYLFSFDKYLIAPADAKLENLKAVLDFVKEYGVYK